MISRSLSARMFGLFAFSLLLFAAITVPEVQAAPTFKRILDTDTPVDGSKLFYIGTPQTSRTLVLVLGAADNGKAYLLSVPQAGGTPKVLASTDSRVPGGVGTFRTAIDGYLTAFQPSNCTAPVAGTSDAVFVGRDSNGNRGLYAVGLSGGSIRKLVNRTTAIPGGPVSGFTRFVPGYEPCNVSVAGRRVVFDTTGGGVYQIMTDGTGLRRIADPNTPATKPPFPVTQFQHPTADGARTVYVGGTVFGPFALYEGAAALGKTPLVVGRSNPLFNQFRFPEMRGGNVIFWAALPQGNVGLFRVLSDGTRTRVFSLASKPPSGLPGKTFGSLGNTADAFVVDAQPKSQSILYARTSDGPTSFANLVASCNGILSKVLSEGDVLDGRAVVPVDGLARVQALGTAAARVDRTATTVGSGRYAAVYLIDLPACR